MPVRRGDELSGAGKFRPRSLGSFAVRLVCPLRLIHARVRVAANRGPEGGGGPRRLAGEPERRHGPGREINRGSGVVAPTVQVARIECLVEGQARLQRFPSVMHVAQRLSYAIGRVTSRGE